MDSASSDILNYMIAPDGLSAENRPLHLRLAGTGGISERTLLPQRLQGREALCDGFEYQVLCVTDNAGLALKDFIGLPAEVQIVTDLGELRRLCGIVTQAAAGESDGALATYQLVLHDALAVMDKRRNTRIFRDKSELDIIALLVAEWRQRNDVLRACFDLAIDPALVEQGLSKREFTMQHNESDAAFIRRLLRRCGIAWYFRPGMPNRGAPMELQRSTVPAHTLVLFNDPLRLPENAAGTVRYHRDSATEERDAINGWCAVRSLQPASASLHSWDYDYPSARSFMTTGATGTTDQGVRGNRLAALLEDHEVAAPHIADSAVDLTRLGALQMGRHDYAAKCFRGEGGVRALAVGEWIRIDGHPELDMHPTGERQFVITAQQIVAQNNLPVEFRARVEQLFSRSGWVFDPHLPRARTASRYKTQFECVRRGIRIVPRYDPRYDLPAPRLQSAIVVGPPNEEIWCDEFGRVKIRLAGTRPADHEHAAGAGSSDTDADSAWVRVASSWAGNGPGTGNQFGTRFLPSVGTEVLIDFLGGDPDKPVIVGQLFNRAAPPPGFSKEDGLPGSKYQSGIRSREIQGQRGNQVRIDDTPGQINIQVASDHGGSQLNLGYLTEPRHEGRGAARGEGAELRTDEHLALRAAKGMLVSAWKGLGGATRTGAQLARDDYLRLLRECGELCRTLGEYAASRHGLASSSQEQDALRARFEAWEAGSNTDPKTHPPAEPVIAVTAPAGMGFATSKAVVTYAGSTIDTVAQQHLQLTAGQCFTLNAGKGISLFSHHDGLSAIAHQGNLLLQSQHDDTTVNAARNLTLTSSEGKLRAMAKVIELVADDGSFIKIGDGSITFGSKNPLKFLAPDFTFDAASTLAAELPVFDSAGADQQFLAHFEEGVPGDEPLVPTPVPGANIKIRVDDGSTVEGRSDAGGKSEVVARETMRMASIVVMSSGDKA